MMYGKYTTRTVEVVKAEVQELPNFKVLHYTTKSGHTLSTLHFTDKDITCGVKELDICPHEVYGWVVDLGYPRSPFSLRKQRKAA